MERCWMTTTKGAKYAHMRRSTFEGLVMRGAIAAIRERGRVLVHPDAIDAYYYAKRIAPAYAGATTEGKSSTNGN